MGGGVGGGMGEITSPRYSENEGTEFIYNEVGFGVEHGGVSIMESYPDRGDTSTVCVSDEAKR